MGLLRADLQAFANSLLGDGRTSLLGRLAPPAILAAMHWMIGAVLLQHRELLQLVHRGGDPMTNLFAQALGPGPVVAGWIGFAQAQRQLFEAPELALWHKAPLWPGRAAVQVLLRAAVTALVWTTALAAPLLIQLLGAAHAPGGAYAFAVLALVGVSVPPLCTVLAAQVLLLRVSSGRWTRLATSVGGSLAAFGFPVFLLAQVFAGTREGAAAMVRGASAGDEPGVLMGAAARLLRAAATGDIPWSTAGAVAVPVLAGLALFGACAPLHAMAVEHHQLAASARRTRRARWPAGTVAVLRKKELAHLLGQPGALLHMALVGALVHLFAAQGTLVHGILFEAELPPALQQCAAMLMLWFLAVLMLLYSHMGRFAAWDGPQWPLFVQAPVAPGELLAAKLQVIAVLLLWPLLVAGWAGQQWLGAGLAAIVPFAGFAIAGNLVALGVVAAVGTWPWLLRCEHDGRLTQGSRGLVGSLVLVFAFYFAISPAFAAWLWLVQHHDAHAHGAAAQGAAALVRPLVLAALGLGALVLAFSLWLASRNYGRLLAAR